MNVEDLLVIAGIDITGLSIVGHRIVLNRFEDQPYFNEICRNLMRTGRVMECDVTQLQNVNKRDWIFAFSKVHSGMDGSGPNGQVAINYIDPPIRGVVTQLNRLGLATMGSCSGHVIPVGRSNPWIQFVRQSDAYVLHKFLKNPQSRRFRGRMMTFFLSDEELLELGLELSKKENLQAEFQHFYSNRELLLKTLLDVDGATGNEGAIREQVLCEIARMRLNPIEMEVDKTGNILMNFSSLFKDPHPRKYKPTILLSAHLDIKIPLTEGSVIVETDGILQRSEGILGADDRAGIALILNVLNELGDYKDTCNVKVVFTVGEEDDPHGVEKIEDSFFWGIDYAVSLDRRNCSDIVTHSPKYHYDHGNILQSIFDSIQRGRHWDGRVVFTPVQGGESDLRYWSQIHQIPSVNLSVGYQNEHTSNEILNLKCWHETHDLLKYFIDQI